MEMQRLGATKVDGQEDDDEDVLLPGFRFHPTDEELVGFYLKRKVEKKPIRLDLIKHIDVYDYEPWDLPREVSCSVEEREWYFFCRRGRKYKNSIRPNRVTRSGFWKATGIDRQIYSAGKFQYCIGLKKSLVYYRGSAGKGTKTDWMMHEFRLPASENPEESNIHEAEVWTLCRIFKREAPYNKKNLPSRQQSCSDSSSKTSLSESENCRQNDENYEVSAEQLIERTDTNDHFYGGNDQPSLTNQIPFSTPYPSINGDEPFRYRDWDELRPMVEFALDPSLLYSIR